MSCRLAFFWMAVVSYLSGRAATLSDYIDFSTAGYRGGGELLPLVPAKIAVAPSGGDDTENLQRAIDYVGWSGAGEDGWRGAVALRPGIFRVAGQLRLNVSGVVLRGNDSTILATGLSRRTLIVAEGPAPTRIGKVVPVVAPFATAGATSVPVDDVGDFSVGDRVVIRRPSTAAWITALGEDRFTGHFKEIRLDWLPGSRDLEWLRTVVAVDPARRILTIDSALTTALEKEFGGGTVQRVDPMSGLRQIGVENIACESEWRVERPTDEEHAWIAVSLDGVDNAFVRGVTARRFAGAGFWIGAGASRVTVQDCSVDSPIAERGGWRRMAFYIGGQQVLTQRCEADDCGHGFAVGHCAAGPNVFLECTAVRAKAESGPMESWASGVLYDIVAISGGPLRLANLGVENQGAGWSAANCILWNCAASPLIAADPPGARNQIVQSREITSLYRAQLAVRRGRTALRAMQATELIPDQMEPSETAPPHLPPLEQTPAKFHVVHGHFAFGDVAIFGGAMNNAWWKGQLNPARAAELGNSLTRWAPGRNGPGQTENLENLLGRMQQNSLTFYHAWPGLWYDRRRDEHSTTLRTDGDVWGPFFESPWARSGRGRASDGLSKYNLEEYNPWYDSRLRDFAQLAAGRGIVLVHYFYNNHNFEENSAHWADFPWRPINCLQETGFPEPPPYEGAQKNAIHIAEQFYDITNSTRRELHRKYIFHGLDLLAEQDNVIHTLGFQFAGPLRFQQFFLDTVGEWRRTRGREVHVALETSKEITEAVLADPKYAALVDIIDQRYWQYLPDTSLFAPNGEGHLAFRELRTARFGADAVPAGTPEQLYRQVREYVEKFPGKAIVTNQAGVGPIPIFMAGGAAPTLGEGGALKDADRAFLKFSQERLGSVLLTFRTREDYIKSPVACGVSDMGARNLVIYSIAGATVALEKALPAGEASWFNPRTGETSVADLGDRKIIAKPSSESWLLYFHR